MNSKTLPSKLIIGLGKFVWTSMWKIMMSQLAPKNQSGEYIRPESQFRTAIASVDIEEGRYHLIVGLSCPWAHRTLIVRALKGLEKALPVSLVTPSPIEGGWVFDRLEEGCHTLAQLYQLGQSGYQGRSTVPVLWDTYTKTIVNNESAEIIVMLNSAFNSLATNPTLDLYPEELTEKIDFWNERIYHSVNNGVYRCGFAQTQAAYEQACQQLFHTLDESDRVLSDNRYLCGDKLTLADIRLFTTLFRFDAVYYGLFKCNLRRIADYKNLSGYLRDIYQQPGVADTCNLEAIKQDYYGNLFPLNPGGIIPIGPETKDLFIIPHNREIISQKQ